MKITSIMTTDLVTVDMDDSLKKVKEIFDAYKFHHLLVVENGKLQGVISDRDLLKSISYKIDSAAATERDLASLNKRVHQIMSRKPITLLQKSSVEDAILLFDEHKISCLPIVDDNDEPVGIVSWRDVMHILSNRIRAKAQ